MRPRQRFLSWLSVWDGSISGFEAMPYAYEALYPSEATALHARLGERAVNEATRCIMGAALRTMPASTHKQACYQWFSYAQLLACEALRLYLGIGWDELRTYLHDHPSTRYLIFGEGDRLPKAITIYQFGVKVTSEQWREFTYHLRSFNPNLAAIYIKSAE